MEKQIMNRKVKRGWRSAMEVLAVSVATLCLGSPGAPAGDNPALSDRGEMDSAVRVGPAVNMPVPAEAEDGAVPSRFAAVGHCPACREETPADFPRDEGKVRFARIRSAAPADGASMRAAGDGRPEDEPCDCDDECGDLTDYANCKVGLCVIQTTGEHDDEGLCQREDAAIGAMCDMDADYCTYDVCLMGAQDEVICFEQTDDGTGTGDPLSPCPKECVGGPRGGLWCDDASECPLGSCEIKPNVTCDADGEYCHMTDNTGRCCQDTDFDGTPETCTTDKTEVECLASAPPGTWVRRNDPDDSCVCPVYSSGVAPAAVGTDLDYVVPPARTCLITGNRCEITEVDCPKICQDGSDPPTLCETDADCDLVV